MSGGTGGTNSTGSEPPAQGFGTVIVIVVATSAAVVVLVCAGFCAWRCRARRLQRRKEELHASFHEAVADGSQRRTFRLTVPRPNPAVVPSDSTDTEDAGRNDYSPGPSPTGAQLQRTRQQARAAEAAFGADDDDNPATAVPVMDEAFLIRRQWLAQQRTHYEQ